MSTNEIIESAKRAGRTHLTEIESKMILEEQGITTTVPKLARSRDEAVSLAQGMGFPVALKVSSRTSSIRAILAALSSASPTKTNWHSPMMR